METIMQGDAYGIPVEVKLDGQELTEHNVDVIEVCVGKYRKTNTDGGVVWDSEENAWTILFTQEETFALPIGKAAFQVRIKLKNTDDVIGTKLPPIEVQGSRSKEIL